MRKKPFSQRMAQRQHPAPLGPAAALNGGRSGAVWAAGVLWLAAGLSAGYWLLQAGGQGPWVPLQGLAPSPPQADVTAVASALGGGPAGAISVAAEPAPVARLRVVGVVVQGRQRGAALIAVDGQPPRPWLVGAQVAEGLVLQSVDRETVRLGETRSGPTTLTLSVPVADAENLPE